MLFALIIFSLSIIHIWKGESLRKVRWRCTHVAKPLSLFVIYYFIYNILLNLHPAFSFVSTITTVVPQMSLDLDAIDACRIWMTIYCRLYFTFPLHIHFRRLFLHLLHRSDVLGPWLHAGPGWREREPKVHEISSSPSSSFYWAIIIWKLTRDEDIQMLGERLPPRCLSFWFPPIWDQTEEIID